MILDNEDKQMIKESLSIYLQVAQQQMPPEQVQQLATKAQDLLLKLDNLGDGVESSNKPAGISDEWFEKVCCVGCEKLSAIGCEDSVTKTFPGKCDPILNYEMKKNRTQN
jgi:hypothetical protein